MSGSIARENPTAPDSRLRRASSAARPVKVVLTLGLAAILAAAFWVVSAARRSLPSTGRGRDVRLLTVDRPFPADGRFGSDPYIGPQVCAECHPGEVALHARSGHARTLRPAGLRRSLARRLDGTRIADPELPEVLWSYRYRDGQLHLARQDRGRTEECILEYAFGSGHHATTFVSVIDPRTPSILEHRLTYYAQEGALGLTPGHETKPPMPGLTPHGGVPPARDARDCFACHTTQVSARGGQGIDESTMIPNVTCERCHGPGRAHVAAARRGAPESELALPFGPDRWTTEELLQFCGSCHRHPTGPRPEQIRRGDPVLARFQPIGLMLSKCYRSSAGALSCVTCHDPHARASSNRAEYDAICQNCHGGPAGSAKLERLATELRRRDGTPPNPPFLRGGKGTETAQTPSLSTPGVVCPVSPRERCVECHMPRVDVGHHLLLSDHWIRIHQQDESPSTDRAQQPGPDTMPPHPEGP
jgi:hypothetical protein